jgi:hypothetical protein
MYLLQFLTSPSRFHEALCFLESRPPFCRHQHSFQKGDSILTLITFPMRGLGRHRENHNCSLLSLTPVTFDFNTFSCYGGSYFATIAVISYICRRPLNLVGLSMPTESMIFLTDVTAYYSEYVAPQNCLMPLSRPPLRALQLSTSTHHSFFELHDTSMGHAHLVCTQFIFTHLMEGWVLQVPFSLQRVTLDNPTIALSYNGTLSRRNIDGFQLYVCS